MLWGTMKLPAPLHSWKLSPKDAVRLQTQLAGRVMVQASKQSMRRIAGLDAAFSKKEGKCIASVVLWDSETREVIEQHAVVEPLTFPYVPGLLSFREAPALLAALKRLKESPDVLMCDGQGIAHPRRFGIASHLGVWSGLPSIGAAKSRLTGVHSEPPFPRGSRVPLWSDVRPEESPEIIGAVLRTQSGLKPLYVSVGHRLSLAQACQVVLQCTTRFRMPEPTRLADRLVTARKKKAGANPAGDE